MNNMFRDLPNEEIEFIKSIEPNTYVVGGESKARLVVLHVLYRVLNDEKWLIVDYTGTAKRALFSYTKHIINEDAPYYTIKINKATSLLMYLNNKPIEDIKYDYGIVVTEDYKLFDLDKYDGILFINCVPTKTTAKKIVVYHDMTLYEDGLKVIDEPINKNVFLAK